MPKRERRGHKENRSEDTVRVGPPPWGATEQELRRNPCRDETAQERARSRGLRRYRGLAPPRTIERPRSREDTPGHQNVADTTPPLTRRPAFHLAAYSGGRELRVSGAPELRRPRNWGWLFAVDTMTPSRGGGSGTSESLALCLGP
ncbi:hypothetical protein NDU88_004014 [Pleurodeles waltl]|uniref:Uncharacterized protein n=1 Tax=Pleurodeles waltl TaxID=8319 RepID=A0AAV7WQP1_PLEWA|nr:hypothetical protein NDU88_004014 [Pleurodeles waltl]